MSGLIAFSTGMCAIALGSIALSLRPIAESARSFNYCVEERISYWTKQDDDQVEQPWTRSNQVAFCNGKVYKLRVTNLNSNKIKE